MGNSIDTSSGSTDKTDFVKELEADKKELQEAFLKFSTKYGDNICGYVIIKTPETAFVLADIVMLGRLFDNSVSCQKQ